MEGLEDGALVLRELGALAEGPGGAGEGADLDLLQLAADLGPGLAGGVLDDAGEQEGEPAQQMTWPSRSSSRRC